MRILVVLQYWYPYEGPAQPIYGAIFEALMRKDHEITILTSFPHYRKGLGKTWDEYRGKLYQKDQWNGATVVRTYVLAPKYRSEKIAVLIRGLNFASFSISSLIAGLLLPRHDLIFLPSFPPIIGALSARIIGALKNTPYICKIQDVYPDMAVKAGLIKGRFLIRILEKLEKYGYKYAKHVSVISETMKQEIYNKGVAEDKISVIPNFCDTDFIQPMSKKNEFAIKYALHEKFVVMFAGNIGMVQTPEYIIKAAECLQKHEDILFVFVGRGENKRKMEQLATNLSLKNIKFLPLQPFSNMQNVWGSADVGLVTLGRGLSTYAVPSKTFGIMASGRPVLAMVDEGSEVWNMVDEAKGGICVPPESPELLAEAVLRLYEDTEKTKEMGNNARRYVVHNFHRAIISHQYEDLFLSIIRNCSMKLK